MGMREKLIELIQSAVNGCATYWAGLIAGHLIANGVTIPVRCKDCKYAENMMPIDNCNGYLMGDCTLRKEDDIIVTTWGDEFCSFGERRSNGK